MTLFCLDKISFLMFWIFLMCFWFSSLIHFVSRVKTFKTIYKQIFLRASPYQSFEYLKVPSYKLYFIQFFCFFSLSQLKNINSFEQFIFFEK